MTRKLPVGTCIRHAVNSVRNNISYAFRISWPWYAAIAVLSIAIFALLGVLAAGGVFSAMHFGVLLLVAASLVAFAAIAVNWHRYILLDEVPKGGDIFRLDGTTWRYLGNLLLIGLMLFIVGMVFMLPLTALTSLSDNIVIVAIVIGVIFFLFIAIFSVRLSVKLPAVALGRRDFTFSHALAATRGNNPQVFLLLLFQFALAIGAGLFGLFLEYLTVSIHPTFGFIVSLLAQLFINWLLTIFGITILTSLYGFFVEQRDF